MQLKKRPYNLLLVAALLTAVLYFSHFDNTIDIHLHDTYFLISGSFVLVALFIFTLLSWGLYALTNRFLFSKTLTWIHIGVILITMLMIIALLSGLWDLYDPGMPRRYYDYRKPASLYTVTGIERTITITTLILLLGHLTYPLNLLLGLCKKKT